MSGYNISIGGTSNDSNLVLDSGNGSISENLDTNNLITKLNELKSALETSMTSNKTSIETSMTSNKTEVIEKVNKNKFVKYQNIRDLFTKDELDSIDLSNVSLKTGYNNYTVQLYLDPHSNKLGGVVPYTSFLISKITNAEVVLEYDANWTAPHGVADGSFDFVSAGWLYNSELALLDMSNLGCVWFTDTDNYLVVKDTDLEAITELIKDTSSVEQRLTALYNAGYKLGGDIVNYSAYKSQSVYTADDPLFVDLSEYSNLNDWAKLILNGETEADFYMTNKYGKLTGLTQIKEINGVSMSVYVSAYGTAFVGPHRSGEVVASKLYKAFDLLVKKGIYQIIHEYYDNLSVELIDKKFKLPIKDTFDSNFSEAFPNVPENLLTTLFGKPLNNDTFSYSNIISYHSTTFNEIINYI